jgi:hypothetical protein
VREEMAKQNLLHVFSIVAAMPPIEKGAEEFKLKFESIYLISKGDKSWDSKEP